MSDQPQVAAATPADTTISAEPLHVLWVGDATQPQRFVARRAPHIRIAGFDVTGAEAFFHQSDPTDPQAPEILVLDASVTSVDPLHVLNVARSRGFDLPLVLLTLPGQEELAAQISRVAVCDCVIKIQDFVYQILPAFAQVRTRHDLEVAFRTARDSEERFRTILETVPATVCVIDHTGQVAAMNRAGLQLLSAQSEQVVGQDFTAFLPHDGHDAAMALIAQTCGGNGGELAHSLIRVDGSVVEVRTRTVPFPRNDQMVALATLEEQFAPASVNNGLIDELTAECDRLKHHIEDGRGAIATLRSEQDAARADWAAAAKSAEEQYSAALEAHKSEHGRLEQAVASATARCAELGAQKDRLAQTLRDQQAQHVALTETVAKAASHASELTAERDRLQQALRTQSDEHATLTETAAAVAARVSALDAERERLSQALQAETNQRAALSDTIRALTAQLSELGGEHNRLQQTLRDHELEQAALAQRIGSVSDETAQVIADRDRLDWALQDSERQRAFAAGEVERLQGDFERVRGELQQAHGDFERARGDFRQAQHDLGQARSDFQQAQNDLGLARNELDSVRGEVNRLHGELTRVAEERDARHAAAIADLQGEHSRLNLAIDGLRAERDSLEAAQLSLRQTLDADHAAARAQWEREARITDADLKAAILGLQSERDEVTARLEESATERRSLAERLEASARHAENAGSDLAATVHLLQSERDHLLRAADERSLELQTLAERQHALDEAARHAGEQHASDMAAIRDLEVARTRLTADLDEVRVRCDALQTEWSEERARWSIASEEARAQQDAAAAAIRSEYHRLAGELEQTRGREAQALAAAGRLEHELAEIRNSHTDQVSSVEAIAAERDRLRATLSDDRDRLSAALKSAEARAETLERQWTAEREQLLAASVEARTHHDAVAQALRTANELLAADLERTRAETADHAARIAEVQAHAAAFEGPTRAELETAHERSRHLVEALGTTRATLRDREAHADDLAQRLAATEARASELAQRLDAAESRMAALKDRTDGASDEERRHLVRLRQFLLDVLCDADSQCKDLIERQALRRGGSGEAA